MRLWHKDLIPVLPRKQLNYMKELREEIKASSKSTHLDRELVLRLIDEKIQKAEEQHK